MTIVERLEAARDLLEQDGWDEGDLIFSGLQEVIGRLREKYPNVADEEMDPEEAELEKEQ